MVAKVSRKESRRFVANSPRIKGQSAKCQGSKCDLEEEQTNRPRSPRKRWIARLSVVVTLVVFLSALWATRTHALLEHATRITEGAFRAYAWQPPNTLALILQTNELEQRNLTNGERSLGSIGPSIAGTHIWRASPDGLILLTFDTSGAFTVVEDKAVIQHRTDAMGWGADGAAGKTPAGAWLPDSRRWLAWSPHADKHVLRLYSVDAPTGEPVSLPMPDATTNLVGVTPDHLVVQTDAPFPPTTAKKITLATFGVYPNRAAVRSVSFPLPVTAEIDNVELAPRGDRLAWLLVDSRRSPLITMLIRLVPSLSGRFPPTEGISVWVSRLDGTEMQEIGFQQTHASGKDTNVATDLRWMPDGKHLSFLMNNSLYSVPAP
ncbi:MAG: hypothetical protein JWN14_1502 [Chthonomonadales bacterium]|nr:hypothetical protein [Chthonomonadales bacterium]